MALPIPADPDFRKAIVGFWLDDIDDRLAANRVQDAETSWKIANEIYLSLPPGNGDMEIEDWLFRQRVRLDGLQSTLTECSIQSTIPTKPAPGEETT